MGLCMSAEQKSSKKKKKNEDSRRASRVADTTTLRSKPSATELRSPRARPQQQQSRGAGTDPHDSLSDEHRMSLASKDTVETTAAPFHTTDDLKIELPKEAEVASPRALPDAGTAVPAAIPPPPIRMKNPLASPPDVRRSLSRDEGMEAFDDPSDFAPPDPVSPQLEAETLHPPINAIVDFAPRVPFPTVDGERHPRPAARQLSPHVHEHVTKWLKNLGADVPSVSYDASYVSGRDSGGESGSGSARSSSTGSDALSSKKLRLMSLVSARHQSDHRKSFQRSLSTAADGRPDSRPGSVSSGVPVGLRVGSFSDAATPDPHRRPSVAVVLPPGSPVVEKALDDDLNSLIENASVGGLSST